MSDSKSRSGKNLRRKWKNTIIVTLKKKKLQHLLSPSSASHLGFHLIPFLHPPSPSAPWAPAPLVCGEFFELPPVSLNTNTVFSHLSPIWATWLLVPCERNPGLLAPQPQLSAGAAWAAVASWRGQGCEVRKGLRSHHCLHPCAWPSFYKMCVRTCCTLVPFGFAAFSALLSLSGPWLCKFLTPPLKRDPASSCAWKQGLGWSLSK